MRLPGTGSLQLQLALSLAAVYITATAIVVAVLVYQAYSTADVLSNEDLSRRTRHLASLVAADASGEPQLELPPQLEAVYRSSGVFLFAVRGPGGRVIAVSHAEVGDLVSRLPLAGEQPTYFRLKGFGAAQKDYFGLTAARDSRVGPLQVSLARAADDDTLVRSLLREFVFNVAWIIPLIIAATLLIGVLCIRRGLRPLRQVSAKAATIDPGTISARLPEGNLPSEVQPLVTAVNRVLDRLERGFAVQRQFTANAAHELRTPLAIVTAGLDELDGTGTLDKLKKDVARMNRLVAQLLRVARLDAIALDVSSRVDLSAVVVEVVAYMAPFAVSRRRALAAQGTDQPVHARGNRHAIEDAVRNVVENAIAHAPAGTEIVVSVDPVGSVSIADRGPGVPPEDRDHVFDRFWRGKGGDASGAGLGLAIVNEIMKAHRGGVQVEDNPGGGAVFTLLFQRLQSAHT